MTSVSVTSAVCLAVCLAAQALPAQQARKMTLAACVRTGLENSKRLHASRMAVQAAEAGAKDASAARLPSLSAQGSYTRLSEVDPFEITLPGAGSYTVAPVITNAYALRASVQQPVYTGHRIEGTADAASLTARAKREDLSADRADLTFAIRRAYWKLYSAVETRKVVDENVAQMEAHLKDAQNLRDQGVVIDNDVLKVRVQLSEARLRQIRAGNAVRLARLSLNDLIGLPLETDLIPGTEATAADSQPADPEALSERALQNRSELKAQALRVQSAGVGIRLARSGRLPQVYLTGGYSYARPNARVQPPEDRFKGTWDVGVRVAMDVWDWGRTGHREDEATANLERARDALALLEDGVRLEVRQHCLLLEEAREQVAVAEEGVQQAEESYRATSEQFRVGVAPNSDLLDAEVALLQARTAHTRALVDLEVAQAGLMRVVGGNAGDTEGSVGGGTER